MVKRMHRPFGRVQRRLSNRSVQSRQSTAYAVSSTVTVGWRKRNAHVCLFLLDDCGVFQANMVKAMRVNQIHRDKRPDLAHPTPGHR